MARGYDEPFTLYGLVARTVETDAERSYVTFTLDPAARFSDGTPITPDDVIFSWQLLRDKGRPNHRTYYAKVAKAEVVGERAVRFDLAGSNDRELPLILGLMPVLAKHAIEPRDASRRPRSQAPLGSGPYVVGHVDPGKSVTFKRNPDYWGRDLPINRGFWNFDEIRFDFYRDTNSHLEAFKRGLYDYAHGARSEALADGLRFSRDARRPRHQGGASDRPAEGELVLRVQHPPGGLRATSACARRSRSCSISSGSITTISSISIGARQLFRRARSCRRTGGRRTSASARCSQPFPDAVRADVLDGTWSPPVSDGSGRDRTTLKRALDLFAAAGYELRGTELVDARAAGRSHSRSWSRRATTSGSRCCSPRA